MKSLLEYLSINVKPNIIHATDETIKKIVKDELDRFGLDADMNHINVSEVTNMKGVFSCSVYDLRSSYKDLNPDISKWDVSKVEDMCSMFFECKNFNQDISNWNVSNVTNMHNIFYGCDNFNCDISQWDVSKVEKMDGMFYKCKNFNQDLSQWDVSKVTSTADMFNRCESFNQDLSQWDLRRVNSHEYMFNNCPIKEEYKPKFKKRRI